MPPNVRNGWKADTCGFKQRLYRPVMFTDSPPRGSPFRGFIILCLCALTSCSGGEETQVSYDLELSPSQAISFKSDLSKFADENGYRFIDGSREAKESRAFINNEIEKSSVSSDLATEGEITHVAVEPESASNFIIFATTSAYDPSKVSLNIIYDETSAAERQMAESFLSSKFVQTWTR